MPNALKHKIAWAAILVIALQALLPGFVALSASAAFDPGTVICHSDPAAELDRSAPLPASTDDCCAQCILCNGLASAPPPIAAPHYVVWALPSDALAAQSSSEPLAAHQPNTSFARGPPLSA